MAAPAHQASRRRGLQVTQRLVAGSLFAFASVSAVVSPQVVSAQEAASTAPSTGAAVTSASASTSAEVVRRDPKGIRGISPFMEAIERGDAAFLAKDFEGSFREYQNAIKSEPKNALGHLRAAELHLSQERVKEAEAALVTAMRFVGAKKALKGHAFFLMSLVREAQKIEADAAQSWAAYKELVDMPEAPSEVPSADAPVDKAPKAPRIYVETADERRLVIERQAKLEADYKAVRERIEQRVKEADESVRSGK